MKSVTLVAMIDSDLNHELRFAFQVQTVTA